MEKFLFQEYRLMKQTSDNSEQAIRQLSDKLSEIIIAHMFNYCFVFASSRWSVEAHCAFA